MENTGTVTFWINIVYYSRAEYLFAYFYFNKDLKVPGEGPGLGVFFIYIKPAYNCTAV